VLSELKIERWLLDRIKPKLERYIAEVLADYDKKYTALENKLEKLEAAPVPVDLSHVRDFLNSDILDGKNGYFSRYKNYIRIISASRALCRALCGVFIACPDSLPLKN